MAQIPENCKNSLLYFGAGLIIPDY